MKNCKSCRRFSAQLPSLKWPRFVLEIIVRISWLVVQLKSRGVSWTKCHREHCNAIFKIWT